MSGAGGWALALVLAGGAVDHGRATRDLQYGLDQRAGETLPVALDADGFTWPAWRAPANGPDTVLLELRIEARRAPRGGAPAIISGLGDAVQRQYFAPGESGVRVLNLSAFAATARAGDRVGLRGTGVAWSTGNAQIHGFVNPPLAGRRVLVIAPHPDDAEIAAFGVYRRSDADVVTVTAGDAGGRNYQALFSDDPEHYRIKGMIRTWDSITVPQLGGVAPARARNLGYYDATLERMWRERPRAVAPLLAEIATPDAYRRANVAAAVRERPMAPTWPSLVADLRAELEQVAPAVVVAPHPLLDNHRDHQFTTLALLEALVEHRTAVSIELYLYTNHPVGAEPFPWGPRDGVVSLWPWFGDPDGRALPFARVSSHPLDREEQGWKLLALEAMHDLRPFDLAALGAEPAAPRRPRRERLRAAREHETYSYLRRAARPNELFLVLSRNDARLLRERFLAVLLRRPAD